MPWIFKPNVIRITREKLGLSATRFGRQMEPSMSGAQILDIETGRRGLTVATLLRICDRYGLSPVAFFERIDPEFPTDQMEFPLTYEDSCVGPAVEAARPRVRRSRPDET
jgi:transcriptional regulator with XRE-family HTH domain